MLHASANRRLAGHTATALLALSMGLAPAGAGEVDAQYAVSIAGLSLGTATLKGNITPGKYVLNAQAHLTGLAGMVTGGKGAAAATGTISGGTVQPGNYSLTAASSDMTRTIQMAMTAGTVQQVVVNPPLEPKEDRVPVTGAHKVGVLDPIAAIMMSAKAGSPQGACDRSIPVFDGAQRFTITLSYAGTRTVAAREGYSGPVLVCKARYTPVAGHRSERPAVKFMAQNREMETWLAPSGVDGIYIPYRVAVKTMIGTTVLEATKFRVQGSEATAGLRR